MARTCRPMTHQAQTRTTTGTTSSAQAQVATKIPSAATPRASSRQAAPVSSRRAVASRSDTACQLTSSGAKGSALVEGTRPCWHTPAPGRGGRLGRVTDVGGARELTVGMGAGDLATADMVLNIGPQRPATHGVLRIRLVVDGERIVSAD